MPWQNYEQIPYKAELKSVYTRRMDSRLWLRPEKSRSWRRVTQKRSERIIRVKSTFSWIDIRISNVLDFQFKPKIANVLKLFIFSGNHKIMIYFANKLKYIIFSISFFCRGNKCGRNFFKEITQLFLK